MSNKERIRKLKRLHKEGKLYAYYNSDSKKRDISKKVGVKLGLITLLISLSACSSQVDMFGNKDLQLSANEEGIASFYDGIVGAMLTAKNKDNIPEDTPYHELRRNQGKERTLRHIRIIPKQNSNNNGSK